MAENKGIMLAKSVQKHAGRAKEKVSFRGENNQNNNNPAFFTCQSEAAVAAQPPLLQTGLSDLFSIYP